MLCAEWMMPSVKSRGVAEAIVSKLKWENEQQRKEIMEEDAKKEC